MLRREQKREGEEVKEEKRRGKKEGKDYNEGGINQTAVPELDTPWSGRVLRTILYHLNVALLVLSRSSGASLTIT